MTGIGLVLGGGAALGAYEIGVYSLLIDMGLDKKITSVAGSSVGAINASIIMTEGGFNSLQYFWRNMKCDQVVDGIAKVVCEGESESTSTEMPTGSLLGPSYVVNSGVPINAGEYDDWGNPGFVKQRENFGQPYGAYSISYPVSVKRNAKAANLYEKEEYIKDSENASRDQLPKCAKGFSSHVPLENMLSRFFGLFQETVNNKKLPIYITAVNVKKNELDIFTQKDRDLLKNKDKIKTMETPRDLYNAILASSSAKPLYDCYPINNVEYRDGGQVSGDNIPYKVLEEEEDPSLIILISLSGTDKLPVGSKYINIKLNPSYYNIMNLVSFRGDFTSKLINIGRRDAYIALTGISDRNGISIE